MSLSFCCHVPHRPESLDLSIPRPALGTQFNLLYVCILLWCPEFGQKFIKSYIGTGLRRQAYFSGIKVILNRVGITELIIVLLRVIVNAEPSGSRPCVSL